MNSHSVDLPRRFFVRAVVVDLDQSAPATYLYGSCNSREMLPVLAATQFKQGDT
jgi:hypothetical protein